MTVINIRSRKQGSAQSQLCSQTTVAFSSICSTSPDSPAMGSSHFRSNMQVLQQVTHENGEKYHIKSIDHHMIPDKLIVESKSPIIMNITEYHGMNRLNRLIHPAARTVLGYSAILSYFLGLAFSSAFDRCISFRHGHNVHDASVNLPGQFEVLLAKSFHGA